MGWAERARSEYRVRGCMVQGEGAGCRVRLGVRMQRAACRVSPSPSPLPSLLLTRLPQPPPSFPTLPLTLILAQFQSPSSTRYLILAHLTLFSHVILTLVAWTLFIVRVPSPPPAPLTLTPIHTFVVPLGNLPQHPPLPSPGLVVPVLPLAMIYSALASLPVCLCG